MMQLRSALSVTAAVLQYVITHTVGLLDQHTQCDATLYILLLKGSSILWQTDYEVWYSTSGCLNVV